MRTKTILIEGISFLFVLLFTYAAASKLLDVEKFRIQIGQSPMLTLFAPVLAWAVPIIELCICVLLFIRPLRLIGLYASFGIMAMFTAYIVAILQFSTYVPCSCGGILSTMGWKEHLVFNIGFVILGLVGMVFQIQTTSKSQIANIQNQ